MKHTKGPWNIAKNDSCCIMANGKHLATAFDSDGGRSESGRGSKNAALIAAAPDLLKSLENILKFEFLLEHEGSPNARGQLTKARNSAYEALNKAKGGE